MKNYFKFTKLNIVEESINFYKSLSNGDLIVMLDNRFNEMDYFLNYYAEFLKELFQGSDYDEHYYLMKSLSETLNDIKIILNIYKLEDNHE